MQRVHQVLLDHRESQEVLVPLVQVVHQGHQGQVGHQGQRVPQAQQVHLDLQGRRGLLEPLALAGHRDPLE